MALGGFGGSDKNAHIGPDFTTDQLRARAVKAARETINRHSYAHHGPAEYCGLCQLARRIELELGGYHAR